MDRHAPGPLDALWGAVAAGQGPAALHFMHNTTQPGALLAALLCVIAVYKYKEDSHDAFDVRVILGFAQREVIMSNFAHHALWWVLLIRLHIDMTAAALWPIWGQSASPAFQILSEPTAVYSACALGLL